MKAVLLDTGPIVATLDAADPDHRFAVGGFEKISGQVVTTGAVVTEAMFFLQDLPGGPMRLVDWLAGIGAEIIDCFASDRVRRATELMERYSDTPMDFADATLVVLAAHLDCGAILTLDERGFRTFRYHRRKSFRLLLQDAG